MYVLPVRAFSNVAFYGLLLIDTNNSSIVMSQEASHSRYMHRVSYRIEDYPGLNQKTSPVWTFGD